MAAADFIMPRLPDPSQNHFFQQAQPVSPASTYQSQYQSQYQVPYNPQISPTSTMNKHSPTSPRAFHTRRQRPLFVPAVLRPTEFPSKAPQQDHVEESEDSVNAAAEADAVNNSRPSTGFMNLAGLSMGRLTRRSTADGGKFFGSEANKLLFPTVTAPPTRKHWKADPASTMCDEPSCQKQFGYFTRRHHCRRCGNIFCDSHSAYQVPLDEDAQYNPRGSLSRSCNYCFHDFRIWRSRTNSLASSDASSTTRPATMASSAASVATAPTAATALTTPSSPSVSPNSPTVTGAAIPLGSSHDNMKKAPHPAEVALSVPRDWNWSTF